MRSTDQLAESILSFAEGLRQSPSGDKSTHPENRAEGVEFREKIKGKASHLSISMY